MRVSYRMEEIKVGFGEEGRRSLLFSKSRMRRRRRRGRKRDKEEGGGDEG